MVVFKGTWCVMIASSGANTICLASARAGMSPGKRVRKDPFPYTANQAEFLSDFPGNSSRKNYHFHARIAGTQARQNAVLPTKTPAMPLLIV